MRGSTWNARSSQKKVITSIKREKDSWVIYSIFKITGWSPRQVFPLWVVCA
jgi:hypothetical protein